MNNLYYFDTRNIYLTREELSREIGIARTMGIELMDIFIFFLDNLDGFKLVDESHLVENFIKNYLNSPFNVYHPLTDSRGNFVNDYESVCLGKDTEEFLFSIGRKVVSYLEEQFKTGNFDWYFKVVNFKSKYMDIVNPETITLMIKRDGNGYGNDH